MANSDKADCTFTVLVVSLTISGTVYTDQGVTSIGSSRKLRPPSLHSVTVNNSAAADEVTFLDDAVLSGQLDIQDGQGAFGAANLEIQGGPTALSPSAGTSLTNTDTGNLILGGDVSNAGSIRFDSSDDAGNGISISSSVGGTQRNWQGSGSYSFTDVSVQDESATGGTPASINASRSTNLGNNVNWVFDGAILTATGFLLILSGQVLLLSLL